MFDDFRIRVFLTVAEEGNFTKAAARLGVSQPAVSQNIADIEQSFNVRLFTRSRDGISLTPEGAAFKAYAQRIADCYDDLVTVFSNFGTITAARPLSLAVDSALLGIVPGKILPYLSGICPGVGVIFLPPEQAENADMTISGEPGRLTVTPSEEFAGHPLFKLISRQLD